MSEGNERQNQRLNGSANYTRHPYYQQQYYAMSMPGIGQPAQPMYAMADPTQPGGYRWVYAAYHPQMMQYYYPYHPGMYTMSAGVGMDGGSPTTTGHSPLEHSQQGQTVSMSSSVSTNEENPPTSSNQLQVTISTAEEEPPSDDQIAPPPVPMTRKTSRGFLKDKSKWRLSRSGSKPSLAIDGIEDGEYMEMPPSPRIGVHKQSFSVSPRHCGSPFLPDEDFLSESVLKQPIPSVSETIPQRIFSKKSNIHLIDAIRIVSGELAEPSSSDAAALVVRLSELKTTMEIAMNVIESSSIEPSEALGLLNPANSKICYLNSVIQMLLPIAPLVQLMSLSLTHVGEGLEGDIPWTMAIARSLRMFFIPTPIGARLSLLTVPGMEFVVKELGGLGSQQDVGEALGIVIEKLHQEWKHRLVSASWIGGGRHNSPPVHLNEDSVIYKLFRGVKLVGNDMEMFTTIHLAPPATGTTSLVELLAQNFSKPNGLIHHAPPVLCIELSRHLTENQLTTSQSSVPFSGSLSFPAASCCTENVNPGRNYQLVGVVVRSGVYANSGHFWVAQCRNNKWSWINDTEVSPISDFTNEDQTDATNNLASKKLNAAHNWCLLIYADPTCSVTIHP